MPVHVLTCVGVDLELFFLKHFVDHYTALGVAPDRIHVLLNSADPDSRNLQIAEAQAQALGLATPKRWIAPYTSETMWEERRALQRERVGRNEWVVNADIDEHHEYPAPLSEIVAFCRRWRASAVQGVMIDRLGPEGSLPDVVPDIPLDTQFPIRADFAISLFGRRRGAGLAGTFKLMLHRGSVFPHRGGHRAQWESGPRHLMGRPLADQPGMDDPEHRFAYPFRVNHYKWTATRAGKIERRLATPGVSENGRHFGGIEIDYLGRHGGIRLSDIATAGPDHPVSPAAWKRASVALRLRVALANLRSPPPKGG